MVCANRREKNITDIYGDDIKADAVCHCQAENNACIKA